MRAYTRLVVQPVSTEPDAVTGRGECGPRGWMPAMSVDLTSRSKDHPLKPMDHDGCGGAGQPCGMSGCPDSGTIGTTRAERAGRKQHDNP